MEDTNPRSQVVRMGGILLAQASKQASKQASVTPIKFSEILPKFSPLDKKARFGFFYWYRIWAQEIKKTEWH